jgi:hypothetical protein
VQDAFVRLVGRFGHLRVPDAFPAYLRRTIVNLHTSGLRRLRLERAYVEREGHKRVEAAALPDVGTPEALWRALQTLPARQRAVVVLRYYEVPRGRRPSHRRRCDRHSRGPLVAGETPSFSSSWPDRGRRST